MPPAAPATEAADEKDGTFLSSVLQPGSSLDPRFLAVLDGAFMLLLLVLATAAFHTSGNPHFFALITIELGLWASVKWFVREVQKPAAESVPAETCESKKEK